MYNNSKYIYNITHNNSSSSVNNGEHRPEVGASVEDDDHFKSDLE